MARFLFAFPSRFFFVLFLGFFFKLKGEDFVMHFSYEKLNTAARTFLNMKDDKLELKFLFYRTLTNSKTSSENCRGLREQKQPRFHLLAATLLAMPAWWMRENLMLATRFTITFYSYSVSFHQGFFVIFLYAYSRTALAGQSLLFYPPSLLKVR